MQFTIVSRSVWSTLQICDRQARRDFGKVISAIAWTVELLTSRQAIQTYRAIWRLMQLVWVIAVLLFLLLQRQVDRTVTQCEAQPIAPAEAIASVLEPQLVTPNLTTPQPVADLSNWESLSPFQLRKECGQRNIRWRNARADGKHLRKNEMVAALQSV